MAQYKLEVHVEDSPPRPGLSSQASCFEIQCESPAVQWLHFVPVPDFFEDGLPPPAQAYLKVCSAVSEASLNDVKPSSPPAALGSPPREAVLPSSGTTVQRRSVLHTEEIVSLFN